MVGLWKGGEEFTIDKWRVIALISVFQRVFLWVFVVLARVSMKPFIVHLYGFEFGRSTVDVSEGIRMLFLKDRGYALPLLVVAGDVNGAFLSLRHSVVVDSLFVVWVPPLIVQSFLEEMDGLCAEVHLTDAPVSAGLDYTKVGREGGADISSRGTL